MLSAAKKLQKDGNLLRLFKLLGTFFKCPPLMPADVCKHSFYECTRNDSDLSPRLEMAPPSMTTIFLKEEEKNGVP